MKLLGETEDATNGRKRIKSQVEKRRRERMNHSLERLRSMLLQEPQPTDGTHPHHAHRAEKAEILEQAVLFLQKTCNSRPPACVSGEPTHSFQDGVASCLQRASQFLGPDGRGFCLASPSLSTRSSFSNFAERRNEAAYTSTSPPPPSTRSILKSLTRQNNRQKMHRLQQNFNAGFVHHPYHIPTQWEVFQNIPHFHSQRANHFDHTAERGTIDYSPTHRFSPVGHTLWRPWP